MKRHMHLDSKSLGIDLKDIICPECHLATLREHPEEKWKNEYLKCNYCGFCRKKEEVKHE